MRRQMVDDTKRKNEPPGLMPCSERKQEKAEQVRGAGHVTIPVPVHVSARVCVCVAPAPINEAVTTAFRN